MWVDSLFPQCLIFKLLFFTLEIFKQRKINQLQQLVIFPQCFEVLFNFVFWPILSQLSSCFLFLFQTVFSLLLRFSVFDVLSINMVCPEGDLVLFVLLHECENSCFSLSTEKFQLFFSSNIILLIFSFQNSYQAHIGLLIPFPWWHWGLYPGVVYHCNIPPALSGDRVLINCPSWPGTFDHPIPASSVAGIPGVHPCSWVLCLFSFILTSLSLLATSCVFFSDLTWG